MRVLVLGATGSIGQQTIEVIKKLKYQLVGISFYKNSKLASEINVHYKYSPLDTNLSNVKNYDELIKKTKPDIVVNAIVGFAGLDATIVTIQNKKTLCLSNKESLVVAGRFITQLAKENSTKIYPIDSEHTALFQILSQNKGFLFKKLYITASGGPFYKYSQKQLEKVTYKQAINHPVWKMGAKISVDSATLVNKCFEIIEAYWYFHTTKIEALYHPTSFIHAIVKYQFKTLMFGCKPDMRTSIMQSLTLFKNSSPYVLPLKQKYILEKINRNKWIPMKWAHVAIKNPKSSLPIIINAANEEAIHLFAKNLISFPTIIKIIQKCIKKFSVFQVTKIEDVYAMDYKIREYIHSIKILKQH